MKAKYSNRKMETETKDTSKERTFFFPHPPTKIVAKSREEAEQKFNSKQSKK